MKINSDLVIFITGGASGLGEATARRFLSLGCRVAIADMDQDRMDTMKAEAGAAASRLLCFKCDVTKEMDVKNAVEGTAREWGTLHVALACAGVSWPVQTMTSKNHMNSEMFETVVKINLFGSVYVAKYAAPIMAKNPASELGDRGLLLFVSSVAGEEGQRGQIAYGASKGAINGMMLPMARDLGRRGIRAVAIAPGIMATPMYDLMSDKLKAILNKDTPLGRPGHVDEFSHFVGAIIENGYLNGVHLRLDGATKLSHM